MRILVLNAGSSSQKTCLYEIQTAEFDAPQPPLWQAKIEWTEAGGARLEIRAGEGPPRHCEVQAVSHQQALNHLILTLETDLDLKSGHHGLDAVGHRVVHGGGEYSEPVLVTPHVKAQLGRLAVFAPLHHHAEIQGMDAVAEQFGDIPQIAVFDTTYHRSLPEEETVYPGPYEWLQHGIRRYGFHGINHQYCAHRAARLLSRDLTNLRLIICHLGSGCSAAAISGGKSVATTMGFTPLEGLMMSTRAGSVDPGILLYLLRELRQTPEQIEAALNHQSGLLGVSGVSSDMREVLAARARGEPRADLAFGIFIRRLAYHVAALVPSLGALDALVFTGGIGENSPEVRAAACERLAFLGVELDAARNAEASADGDLATPNSKVRALMIRAQEDWVIAQACWRMLGETLPSP